MKTVSGGNGCVIVRPDVDTVRKIFFKPSPARTEFQANAELRSGLGDDEYEARFVPMVSRDVEVVLVSELEAEPRKPCAARIREELRLKPGADARVHALTFQKMDMDMEDLLADLEGKSGLPGLSGSDSTTTTSWVLRALAQLADDLKAAARVGVHHFDVAPKNIMVGWAADGRRHKVLKFVDWGAAYAIKTLHHKWVLDVFNPVDLHILVEQYRARRKTGRPLKVLPTPEFAYAEETPDTIGAWRESLDALLSRLGWTHSDKYSALHSALHWTVFGWVLLDGGLGVFEGVVDKWPTDPFPLSAVDVYSFGMVLLATVFAITDQASPTTTGAFPGLYELLVLVARMVHVDPYQRLSLDDAVSELQWLQLVYWSEDEDSEAALAVLGGGPARRR